MITRTQIEQIRKQRSYQSLVLIDLSVPRVIEAKMNDFDEIFLFDVDDLAQMTQKGIIARRKAAERAIDIIEEESQRCWNILVGEKKNNQIGDVFREGESIRNVEMERFLTQIHSIPNLDDDMRNQIEDYANRMSKSLVKKVLHNPIQNVKKLLKEGKTEESNLLLDAFLDPSSNQNHKDES